MQLITESSAWWAIGCLLLGAGYAFLLYGKSSIFTPWLRRSLALFRAITVALIAFLLLSPLIRTISREKEKPLLIIAADNSESIRMSDTAVALTTMPAAYATMREKLSDKFDVHLLSFSDRVDEGKPIDYRGQQTDFGNLIQELNARYTNRNVGAIVVASDGLYNKGGNPVYATLDTKAPIYTIALGDTTVQKDLILSAVNFNKIVYLGNSFPVEVSVDARECSGANFTLTVSQDSVVLFSRAMTASGNRYRTKVPVLLDAKKKGMMRLKVSLTEISGEATTVNNAREIIIEVRESKEKILVLANAPHPDLGAIKSLLESSLNYEVDVHMVDDDVKVAEYNLVISHNLPSSRNSFENRYKEIKSTGLPVLFILGNQTLLPALNQLDAGLSVVSSGPSRSNPVQIAMNAGFSLFTLDEKVKERVGAFPPLSAPFGEYKPTGNPSVLFYQQIGAVKSNEPLLFFTQQERTRNGFLCGEGCWRWPMSEFAEYGEQEVSRELIVKSVQYLSVKDNRSKFRLALKNSFNENEPVVVDAEVYNDNYELVTSPEVTFDITDRNGKIFPFVFSKSDRSYNLNTGFLAPGDYRYAAAADFGDHKLTAAGSFSVAEISAEQTETVADHAMLAALAKAHDGAMYSPGDIGQLTQRLLADDQLKSVSYSQVKLQDLINLKAIFYVLLMLLSVEWLLRKRAGSY